MRTDSSIRKRVRTRLGNGAAALMFLAFAAVVANAQTTTTILRVNAGGDAYTDSQGNAWSADTGYNSGNTYTSNPSISGTSDPTLYNRGRYDATPTAPTLQYTFVVPNGWYEVRLHFAEGALAAGGRKFNVSIEGARVYSDFDVAAEAGGILAALIKKVNVRVTDGQLNLSFLHGSLDNPFINAIEVANSLSPSTPTNIVASIQSASQINLRWAGSSDNSAVVGYSVERCEGSGCTSFTEIATPTTPFYMDSGLAANTLYRYRIRANDDGGTYSGYSDIVVATTTVGGSFSAIRVNAGGSAYTDTSGNVWSADTGYNSGTVYTTNATVTGTSDPALYQSGRFDSSSAPPILQYDFAVPNGSYQVRLQFAEAGLAAGGRKFNVVVNGTTAFTNLDVAAEAGMYATLIKNVSTSVTNGHVTLQLLHGAADNPFINAIEIIQVSTSDRQAPSTPAGLVATPVSSSRIKLQWSASTDNVAVSAYRIERCQGTTCTNFAQIGSVTGTSFSDTATLSQTPYRYRVRAVDAASNVSAYSMPASATSLDSDAQAPTAPSSLSATATSVTQISLSWSASTDNAAIAEYRVERCQGSGCTHFVQIGSSTGLGYTDAGLMGGSTYRYRVRAADTSGNLGAYSGLAAATTSGGSGDTVAPTAPATLAATAYSSTRVDLVWGTSTDNVAVTSYFVERCEGASCTNFVEIAAIDASLSYHDKGLVGNTTYGYRIRSGDAAGNRSSYSPTATVATSNGIGNVIGATYEYDSRGRLKQVTVAPN